MPDALVVGDADSSPNEAGGRKRVFMSRADHDGNFGSLGAMDQICKDEAGALGGTWLAWASAENQPASQRHTKANRYLVKDAATQSATPALTPAGDGYVAHMGLRSDADGNQIGSGAGTTRAWTGTTAAGAWSGSDCGGWNNTGAKGTAGASGSVPTSAWSDSQNDANCDATLHLYCFEQ